MLSAPGRAPSAGKDVLLASGAAEGIGAESAVTRPVDLGEEVAAEVAATDATPETTPVPRRPAARRRVGRTAVISRPLSATKPVPAKAKVTVTTTGPSTMATPAIVAAAKVTASSAPAAPTPPPAPTPVPVTVLGGDAVWNRLAQCESSNSNDLSAPYYGYWQLSAATWHFLGEPGLPNEQSRERQLAAAKRLQAARGWVPWPECSRRLGLR